MSLQNLYEQPDLFDKQPTAKKKTSKIVNVASVKHLSPFRYPGGKTWLVPRMREWMQQQDRPANFVETFAGGAIIGLTVAAENLADHVTLIELDPDVAAVWHTIFSKDADWLANEILNFDLTVENVRDYLAKDTKSTKVRALKTILKNRTYHGGILAPGSGLLKGGENGKGIKSRWYPETLAKRIRNLIPLKDKITFLEQSGLDYIAEQKDRSDIIFFIDPPYTAPGKRAGKRLYLYSEVDHELLFTLCEEAKANFLMTYDNAESVREMSMKHGFSMAEVAMKNTHHSKMSELLITRF